MPARLPSVEEALASVLAHVAPVDLEVVALADAAGRVLAEEIRADAAYPAWARSRVDGYAIRSGDVADGGGELRVACEVAAGRAPGDRIGPGEAARVFTGAPVPHGADAVVKQEDCATPAPGRVAVASTVVSGANVTPAGAECGEAEVVARPGDLLHPARIGVLATVGAGRVRVARRPRVRIVSTGSELVPVGETPRPGAIRNSNAFALEAAVRVFGGDPIGSAIANDTAESHRDALAAALTGAPVVDVVLVTGGVSVGDYDLVPAALASLGVERVLHGVSLQPGKPLWFGVRGPTLVFGLPGNPVSSLVNSVLFVRPALRRMLGREPAAEDPVPAVLGASLGRGAWRRRYVPVRLSFDTHALVATPVRYAGSGDVFGLARADGLAIVPEDSAARAAGEAVRVVPLFEGLR